MNDYTRFSTGPAFRAISVHGKLAEIARNQDVSKHVTSVPTATDQDLEERAGNEPQKVVLISRKSAKYIVFGAVIGGAAPLLASYVTGTHAEMEPIATKAFAAVSFTGAGAGLGWAWGVIEDNGRYLVDNVRALADYILNRPSTRKESQPHTDRTVL